MSRSRKSKNKGRGKRTNNVVPMSADLPVSLPGASFQPPHGAMVHHSRTEVTYSGPIPPPHFMREFNEIIPNGADRILTMAEQQTSHRIAMEKQALKSGIRRSWGGLVAGFIIGMTAIILGAVIILNGYPISGSIFSGVGISGLVGTFVYGKRSTAQERAEKNKQMKRR